MNRPDHETARARIRVLNAIPERDRTDAEWDELNELEIMMAPGNREGAPDPSRLHGQQNRPRGTGGNPGGNPNNNGGGGQHRRNKKNFQHRRPKGPPQGSSGSSGSSGPQGGA